VRGDVAEGICVCLRGVVVEGVLAGNFDLGELGEDPDEVLPRIKLPSAAALDDGEPDGVGLPCLSTAHEEPVLSP